MTLRDKLREALKARIRHDVGEDRFDPSTWHTTQLGDHYNPPTDPLAKLAVIMTVLRESFTPILDDEGVPLSNEQWSIYFEGITTKSTSTSAVTRLLQIL